MGNTEAKVAPQPEKLAPPGATTNKLNGEAVSKETEVATFDRKPKLLLDSKPADISESYSTYATTNLPCLYDCFMAAHKEDNIVAAKLAAHLRTQIFKGRPLKIYMDAAWKSRTEIWKCVLDCSVVVVLLISESMLNDIQDSNGQANDNLMLIEIALKKFSQSQIMLFSFFVENTGGTAMRFPDMAKFVVSKHQHPLSFDDSVLDTMQRLFQLQARQLSLDSEKCKDRTNDIVEVINKGYQSKVFRAPLAVVDQMFKVRCSSPAESSLLVAAFQVNEEYNPVYGQYIICDGLSGRQEYEHDMTLTGRPGDFKKAMISPDLTALALFWLPSSYQLTIPDGKVELWSVTTREMVWERYLLNVMEIAFAGSNLMACCLIKKSILCVTIMNGANGVILGVYETKVEIDWYRRSKAVMTSSLPAALLALGYNSTIIVWNIAPNATEIPMVESNSVVEDNEIGKIALSLDGSLLVVGLHKSLRVYSYASSKFDVVQIFDFSILYTRGNTPTLGVLAVSEDNLRIFVSGDLGNKVYNVMSHTEERAWDMPRVNRGYLARYYRGDFLRGATGVVAHGLAEIAVYSLMLGSRSANSAAVKLVQTINTPLQYPIMDTVAAVLPAKQVKSLRECLASYQTLPAHRPASGAGQQLCIVNEQENIITTTISKIINSQVENVHAFTVGVPRRRRHIVIVPQQSLVLVFCYSHDGRRLDTYDMNGGDDQAAVYSTDLKSGLCPEIICESVVSYDGTFVWFRYALFGELICCLKTCSGKICRALRVFYHNDGTAFSEIDPGMFSFTVSTDNSQLLAICLDGLRYMKTYHSLDNAFFPAQDIMNAVFLVDNLCCYLTGRSGKSSRDFIILDYVTCQSLHRIENSQGYRLFPGVHGSFWMQRQDHKFEWMHATHNKIVKKHESFVGNSENNPGIVAIINRASNVYGSGAMGCTFNFVSNNGRSNNKMGYAVLDPSGGVTLFSIPNIETYMGGQTFHDPLSAQMVNELDSCTNVSCELATKHVQHCLGFGIAGQRDAVGNMETGAPVAVSDLAIAAAAASVTPAVKLSLCGCNPWKCNGDKTLVHDVFISYRVWCEKDLSMKLALHLSRQTKKTGRGDRVIVFLDRLCLNNGEDWECGFLNGLNHSSLVVLLISENTFKGIMEADKRQDNVLLEYEYALRMAEKNEIVLLPMMVNNNNDTNSPCEFPDLSKFPALPHASKKTTFPTVRATMQLLRDNYQRHAISPADAFLDSTNTILSALATAEDNGLLRRMRLKALSFNHSMRCLRVVGRTAATGQVQLEAMPMTDESALSKQISSLGELRDDIKFVVVPPSVETAIDTVYLVIKKALDWLLVSWSMSQNKVAWSSPLENSTIFRLILSNNSSFLVVGSSVAISVHSTRDGALLSKHNPNEKNGSGITGITLSPDDRILLCCVNGAMQAIDLSTGSVTLKKKFRGFYAELVCCAAVGQHVLISGQEDCNLMLLLQMDNTTGTFLVNPIFELEGNISHVTAVALSASGNLLASVNDSGAVRVYAVDSAALLWSSDLKFANPKSQLEFSRDDAVLSCVCCASNIYCCMDAMRGGIVWRDEREATTFTFATLVSAL